MSNRTVILFDFDGTIALGHGPVFAYAHHVAAALGGPEGFVEDVRAALSTAGEGALDGYDAVRRAAELAGADAAVLSAAYLTSRGQLASAEARITAPDGLADFLVEVDAECILVTNAPDIRIAEALAELGLAGLFNRIVTDAGKPAGLEVILDALPANARVLSIGDIWHNDLAPVHRRGHATALVGGFADPAATPTFRAATLTALLPQLREWAGGSADLSSATTHTHTEG